MTSPPPPRVPVAWGELLDKITILEIKTERLPQAQARANAAHELAQLREVAALVLARNDIAPRVGDLKILNAELWDIENRIRGKERDGEFDDEFIELARAVYRRNDARGALKRTINLMLSSELVEEKSYTPY